VAELDDENFALYLERIASHGGGLQTVLMSHSRTCESSENLSVINV
jgi:hypothetical protein